MSDPKLHPLTAAYLKRFEKASRVLPRDRRKVLTEEIERHLVEAVPPEASAADAAEALERLGTPEEIISAEMPGRVSAGNSGTREAAAILLLLFGGFIFVIGWFFGLFLL